MLASIRRGEYLFKRADLSHEVVLDLARKTKRKECKMGFGIIGFLTRLIVRRYRSEQGVTCCCTMIRRPRLD
ncbi:MAG: hypothetical protein DWQ09_01445 [Proteobacteria bacterium]|nr:MAG: hypothetical protein DWQ09_01445 [Pseudomonadota bacterium]